MKRKIIAGKEFCTYVKTPLIADDVHAYNVIWDTGVTDKNAGMVITAKRSDGVVVTDYSVTDKQGRGEYTLAGNMYSVTGPLEIRLSLVWETTTLTEKVLIFEVIEGSGNEKIDSEDNVPILNTILAKATEAVEKTSNMPTKLSQFENDSDFVQDSDYVHTDNNFTNAHKNTISTNSTQIAGLKENFNTTLSQLSEVEEELKETASVAKGANQAISFADYSSLAEHFNSLTSNDTYNTGQNVMIVTVDVPDLWISEKTDEFKEYTYVSDEEFVNELNENKILQIGFYKFSQLETQKVNLEEYIKYDSEREHEFSCISFWRKYVHHGYAVCFKDYEEMLEWFNLIGCGAQQDIDIVTAPFAFSLFPGQYISILDTSLPDLVVEQEIYIGSYEMKSNEEVLSELKEKGYIETASAVLSIAGFKNPDKYATKEDLNDALKSAISDSWEAEV